MDCVLSQKVKFSSLIYDFSSMVTYKSQITEKMDEYKYGKIKLFDNKSETLFLWDVIFAHTNI